MKIWHAAKWIGKALIILIALAAILIGVAFLPGSIEGNYKGVTCMCDSVNIIRYQGGKMISYSSGHPPAELLGRDETAPDGGDQRVSLLVKGRGKRRNFCFVPAHDCGLRNSLVWTMAAWIGKSNARWLFHVALIKATSANANSPAFSHDGRPRK